MHSDTQSSQPRHGGMLTGPHWTCHTAVRHAQANSAHTSPRKGGGRLKDPRPGPRGQAAHLSTRATTRRTQGPHVLCEGVWTAPTWTPGLQLDAFGSLAAATHPAHTHMHTHLHALTTLFTCLHSIAPAQESDAPSREARRRAEHDDPTPADTPVNQPHANTLRGTRHTALRQGT